MNSLGFKTTWKSMVILQKSYSYRNKKLSVQFQLFFRKKRLQIYNVPQYITPAPQSLTVLDVQNQFLVIRWFITSHIQLGSLSPSGGCYIGVTRLLLSISTDSIYCEMGFRTIFHASDVFHLPFSGGGKLSLLVVKSDHLGCRLWSQDTWTILWFKSRTHWYPITSNCVWNISFRFERKIQELYNAAGFFSVIYI